VAKQPRSWWPADGEIRPSKRHDEGPLGAERVNGPYDEESCCAVTSPLLRQGTSGSRARGLVAKAMDGAKYLERQHPRTRRRMGSGTSTQPITEQESASGGPPQSA